MGVGMNEAGKLGSALAAVGVASRMIGQEKNEALNQGSAAFQQNKADEADLAKMQTQESDEIKKAMNAQKDVNTLKNMANDPKNNGINTVDDWKAHNELLKGALDDKMAAQRALDELATKQEAIAERMQRQEIAMAKGRRWGGNY